MIFRNLLIIGILYLESKRTERGSPIRGQFVVKVHRLIEKWRLHWKACQFSSDFYREKWLPLESSWNKDSKNVRRTTTKRCETTAACWRHFVNSSVWQSWELAPSFQRHLRRLVRLMSLLDVVTPDFWMLSWVMEGREKWKKEKR